MSGFALDRGVVGYVIRFPYSALMRPFLRPERLWTDPQPKLHIYWVPSIVDPTDTGGFIEKLHAPVTEVLAGHPPLAVVDQSLLHMTVAMVDDPAADRDALVESLTAALAPLRPFPFTIFRPTVGDSAVVYDTDADADPRCLDVYAAVAGAIEQVVGAAPTHNPFPPHITAAYSLGGGSGAIGSMLRKRVRALPVRATMGKLALVEVNQRDDAGRLYTFRVLDTFLLLGEHHNGVVVNSSPPPTASSPLNHIYYPDRATPETTGPAAQHALASRRVLAERGYPMGNSGFESLAASVEAWLGNTSRPVLLIDTIAAAATLPDERHNLRAHHDRIERELIAAMRAAGLAWPAIAAAFGHPDPQGEATRIHYEALRAEATLVTPPRAPEVPDKPGSR